MASAGGSVWAATSRGLVSSTGESVVAGVGAEGGYVTSDVTAVAADRLGRLWIGKRNGAVYVWSGGTLEACEKAEPIRRHRVDSIVDDGLGGVWVASSFGNGVSHYKGPGVVTNYAPPEYPLAPTRVSAIAIDVEGHVFFGSPEPRDESCVVEYDGEEFVSVRGVGHSSVSAMAFDRDGRLWIGGDDGLVVYDVDYEIRYGLEDGLPSELISALLCDSAGRLWIGTEGGGLAVYDGRAIQCVSWSRSLCNTVNAICATDEGVLWIATNGGLVRRVLRPSDVVVEVSEVIADRSYSNLEEEVQVPDTVSRIAVAFYGKSGIDRPSHLVYRYRLQGVDHEWRQTSGREVVYHSLRAGHYRFSVLAVDRDLNFSDEKVVGLAVVSDPRIDALNQALRSEGAQGELVGHSQAMAEVVKQIAEVAWTDLTVLVLGETGTGKGLAARQIHELSERKEKAFIHVNCGAVQENLVDSELFGHERGAFTGALSRRLGKFELAQGGTIFLDEIGDLPLESQTRLLRVLQERTMERVGGTQTLSIDVRVIAATNRDLSEAVKANRFRPDLFYRLNVFPLRVPPLRERREDAPQLANHFVRVFAAHLNREVPEIDPSALKMIEDYDWPGNVRELEHTMQRAVILCQGGVITRRELGLPMSVEIPTEVSEQQIIPLAEFERRYFLKVLESTGGVIHGKRGAARLLEMKPTTLRSRLEKLGILQNRKKEN